MKYGLLVFILCFVSSCTGKSGVNEHDPSPDKDTIISITEKFYITTIEDFIKALSSQGLLSKDTLFFIDRKNNQPDDFPDIKLPDKIFDTQISITKPENNREDLTHSRTHINMIGWIENERAEFVFIYFSNGYKHQFDYSVTYHVDAEKNNLKKSSSGFKFY